MTAVRIQDFDTWRPGYAGAVVTVYLAGTTTKATLYSDYLLTQTLSNPVSLLSQYDDNGTGYGKFQQTVYVGEAYQLFINSTDTTGVVPPPITSLSGQDAGLATTTSTRGSTALTIKAAFDGVIDIRFYGEFSAGAGASTSTTTLNAAIGAAAAQGGGEVLLPAGTVAINAITLSAGVVLRGQDRAATILTCTTGAAVVTLGGDGAGLRDMTLSGLTAASGSIGVYGIARERVILDRVKLASFDRPFRFRGLTQSSWRDVVLDGNSLAGDIRGDVDAGGGSAGGPVNDIVIIGGAVANSAGQGLLFECIDRLVQNVRLVGIVFDTNIGNALAFVGTRNVTVDGCHWTGNTAALSVADGSDTSYVDINTTQQVYFRDGVMSGGTATFDGTCLDVQMIGMEFANVDLAMSIPTNPILLVDAITDALTTVGGDQTKLVRTRTIDLGQQVEGTTTDATATTGWEYDLADGETVLVEAKILARRRNGTDYAAFWKAAACSRPGATLTYKLLTSAHTVGAIVTGQTSGASARITDKTTVGTDGTLTLRDIVGTFIDGEDLSDNSGGGASKVNGTIAHNNAALDDIAVTSLRADGPSTTTYAATIDASVGKVRVRITGTAAHTVEWVLNVVMTRP